MSGHVHGPGCGHHHHHHDEAPDATPASVRPWPVEIRVRQAEKRLEVDFDTGESFVFSAEFLRVESPSAEVQGHVPDQKITVAGKQLVGIRKVDPIGNYAIRITFDDGHDTGFYSWDYLYDLGRDQERLWADYLAKLDAGGQSREPFAPKR